MPEDPSASERLAARLRQTEEVLARSDAQARDQDLKTAEQLHDDLLQVLASAVVRIHLARVGLDPERRAVDLARAEELTRTGVSGLRELSHAMRQRSAMDADLPGGLRAMIDRTVPALAMEIALEATSERLPVDRDLTTPILEGLRVLLLEVRVRGGSASRIRYADGSGSDLVLEISAPELGDTHGREGPELERSLESIRRRLAPFDVGVVRGGQAVRFIVPAALVDEVAQARCLSSA